ncbi:hypothetical protein [Cypionkella sp. TWP1-2-1b2]|uniref:hypothetical protein n=1 Tax=Cypionkella sp. TWP1-2-1b2 TaxID=2804675 RepID=UPI003CF5B04E
MDKSQILSGIGHAVVITWVVLGDWLFAPRELPPPESVQVSMVSESDLKAMQDAAAKSVKPKADKPEVKPAAKPAPKPQVEAPAPVEPEVAVAEPSPVEPAQPSPDIPVAVDPQPNEAPPVVAPIAEAEQPIPVPLSTVKPKPRSSTKITDMPMVSPEKTPEVADQTTPEVTDQPTNQPVVEEQKPAAAPEDAAAQTAPDAVATDAPELAPTASVRPRTRPDKPVVETPVEDPQVALDAQAEKDAKAEAEKQAKADEKAAKKAQEKADAQAKADAEATQAAVDAALAAEVSDAPVQDGGQTDIPEGPPMTAGEKDGLRVSINQCWNIGTLSTAAQRIKLTLRVEMKEDGTPDSNGITMTTFSGGDEAAAVQAFDAARRAVIRGVKGCGGKAGYDLDPAKYSEWNVMNLNFDASGMRLR